MMRTLARLLTFSFAFALLGGGCSAGPALDLGDDFEPESGAGGSGGEAASAGAGGNSDLDGSTHETDGGGEAGTGGQGGAPDGGPRPECTSDIECRSGAPRCDDGRCVECLEASDCTDEERPACSAGSCVECTAPECEENSCDGEDCEEPCENDGDCTSPERAHCSNLRCVECTEDAHCTENGEPHACRRAEGECE